MLRVAACDWCDAQKNDSPGGFPVLPPVFRLFGAVSRVCGPVVTLTCFENNSLAKAAVDGSALMETPAGRVPAVLVIDGCVRDVVELAQCQLGLRALDAMPLPMAQRNEGQRGVAGQIQGVWLYPGDWLDADEDGIVVMPALLQA